MTFRPAVVSLRAHGQSPVLPFARCVGLLLSVSRCGRCSCWCRFRVRSPVVGVPGLCWMWRDVPFARQWRPVVGVLRLCWLLPLSLGCFCRPHASVHRPSITCLTVFPRASPPPPRVTFRLVVAPLRGPGRSPVLPFACCVGSLLSVGRCGRCSSPPPPRYSINQPLSKGLILTSCQTHSVQHFSIVLQLSPLGRGRITVASVRTRWAQLPAPNPSQPSVSVGSLLVHRHPVLLELGLLVCRRIHPAARSLSQRRILDNTQACTKPNQNQSPSTQWPNGPRNTETCFTSDI